MSSHLNLQLPRLVAIYNYRPKPKALIVFHKHCTTS